MSHSARKSIIVLSSPSGGGKSTIAKYLMKLIPDLEFSVSATTRDSRPGEANGLHYHFMSMDAFREEIDKGGLVEYEEIFGNFYGTLKSDINMKLGLGKKLLFDVDVKGALSLRKAYPDQSLLIFIAPPSLEVLEQRLRARGTETEDQIQRRIARSKMEIAEADNFDYVVVNGILEETYKEIEAIAKTSCIETPI